MPQITLDISKRRNKFQQIVSPDSDDDGVWIHQDAWFHLGTFDKGISAEYSVRKSGNGVYAFIIRGEVSIEGTFLKERDGFGIWNTEKLNLKSLSTDTEVLLMEVPMNY